MLLTVTLVDQRRSSSIENSYPINTTILSNPGLKLRDRRQRLGITQEDLAYGICSVPHYSRIESGVDRPSRQEFYFLAERLQIRNACYNDFYSELIPDSRAILMRLQNEAILDHWDNVGDIISVYAASNQSPSVEAKQMIEFFELLLSYYTDVEFTGYELCERAFIILRYTRSSFSWENIHIDFVPTLTEFMLLNTIACGMFDTHQEALYIRARMLVGELICLLNNQRPYAPSKNGLICLLINLCVSELVHGDLNEARRHLDMIPAFFSCSGGFYLYCKSLRCEYYYYKKCGFPHRCEETVSEIRSFLARIPGSPSVSTFMKNSPKIMVF